MLRLRQAKISVMFCDSTQYDYKYLNAYDLANSKLNFKTQLGISWYIKMLIRLHSGVYLFFDIGELQILLFLFLNLYCIIVFFFLHINFSMKTKTITKSDLKLSAEGDYEDN